MWHQRQSGYAHRVCGSFGTSFAKRPLRSRSTPDRARAHCRRSQQTVRGTEESKLALLTSRRTDREELVLQRSVALQYQTEGDGTRVLEGKATVHVLATFSSYMSHRTCHQLATPVEELGHPMSARVGLGFASRDAQKSVNRAQKCLKGSTWLVYEHQALVSGVMCLIPCSLDNTCQQSMFPAHTGPTERTTEGGANGTNGTHAKRERRQTVDAKYRPPSVRSLDRDSILFICSSLVSNRGCCQPPS